MIRYTVVLSAVVVCLQARPEIIPSAAAATVGSSSLQTENDTPQAERKQDLFASASQAVANTPLVSLQQSEQVPADTIVRDAYYPQNNFGFPSGRYKSSVSQDDDFFHTAAPPPLKATTYGPAKPVVPLVRNLKSFNSDGPYQHRFNQRGIPRFQQYGKPLFQVGKPSYLKQPVSYNQPLNDGFQPKSNYHRIKHNYKKFPIVESSQDDDFGSEEFNMKPQREHEIPAVITNVRYENKENQHDIPGSEFYSHYGHDFFSKFPTRDESFEVSETPSSDEFHDEKTLEEALKHGQHFSGGGGGGGGGGSYGGKQYIPPSSGNSARYHGYLPPATSGGFGGFFKGLGGNFGGGGSAGDDGYGTKPVTQNLSRYYKRPGPEIRTVLPHDNDVYKVFTGRPSPQNQFTIPNHQTSNNYGFDFSNDDFSFPSFQGFANVDKSLNLAASSKSEWTPINAPEGTVPAKSYDIPAPDLSRGDPNKIFRRDAEDQSVVIGKKIDHSGKVNRKIGGNSEGVVSAVVRVKQ